MLKVNKISKKFKKTTVVDNLFFSVDKGKLLGYLVKMVLVKQQH